MDITLPRHLKIANWSVLAVLVLAGFFWRGREFALGILVGGLVIGINFHLLHYALRGTLEQLAQDPQEGSSRAKAWFAGRQLLRFLALLVIIFLLVSFGWVNIFGLLVGLSTVVLTLMLAALHETIKLKNKEANPSHGTPHSIS
ncbi:MAG: ATP synthase subunit I [Deltaproteobacteria bacterium]|nr:ATP synthase subunit I [Deltaproteobacteria bacterium]